MHHREVGAWLVAVLLTGGIAAEAEETLRLAAAADAAVGAGSSADDNAGTAEAFLISGYLFDPSAPGIVVEPAQPKAGDRLSVRIKAPSLAADGKPIRCNYLWHRRQGRRLILIQKGKGPLLQQAVRTGERWRVFVVANAASGRTAMSWAEVQVAGGDAKQPVPAKTTYSQWGQFLLRRAYVAFDPQPLAGRQIVSARLALYAQPDASWHRKTTDMTILVHAVPRQRAAFDETRVTWRTQPTPDLAGEPIARIDMPGRLVTKDDPDWQAWSKLHKATWEQRGQHARAFAADPQYGIWRWREVDVTAAVKREAAAGARRIVFSLSAAPGVTDGRASCAFRSREYQKGRYAPALVVTCKGTKLAAPRRPDRKHKRPDTLGSGPYFAASGLN